MKCEPYGNFDFRDLIHQRYEILLIHTDGIVQGRTRRGATGARAPVHTSKVCVSVCVCGGGGGGMGSPFLQNPLPFEQTTCSNLSIFSYFGVKTAQYSLLY